MSGRNIAFHGAWLVRGDDGFEPVIHPESFDIKPSSPGSIDGGSATKNVQAVRTIFEGKTHPARAAIIPDAAAAFAVCRELDDGENFPDLAAEATHAIDSRNALRKLETLRMTTTLVRSAA